MIEGEIRELLSELNTEIRKNYDRAFRDLNLYVGQETALYHLWQQDGISQTELRNLIGCEASTMSNMLRKLEADGVVYRKRHKHDARTSLVYLTDKGKGLQGPVTEIWKEEQEKMLAGFLPEELLLMRRMFKEMIENVKSS